MTSFNQYASSSYGFTSACTPVQMGLSVEYFGHECHFPCATQPTPLVNLPAAQTQVQHTKIKAPKSSHTKGIKNAKGKGKAKAEGYVPRPPNSWILYRSWWCEVYGPTCGKVNRRDWSVLASFDWHLMSEEERAPWTKKAAEAKAQHALDYPDYRYNWQRGAKGTAVKNTERKPAKKIKAYTKQTRIANPLPVVERPISPQPINPTGPSYEVNHLPYHVDEQVMWQWFQEGLEISSPPPLIETFPPLPHTFIPSGPMF